jgi:hypothetical protein
MSRTATVPPRSTDARHLAAGGGDVVDVVQREAADDDVELRRGERQPRRVALDEDHAAARSPTGRRSRHLGREVDDDREGRRAREVARHLAGAAGDVEHDVARTDGHVRADPLEDVSGPEDRSRALEGGSLARELAARDVAVFSARVHRSSLASKVGRAGRPPGRGRPRIDRPALPRSLSAARCARWAATSARATCSRDRCPRTS